MSLLVLLACLTGFSRESHGQGRLPEEVLRACALLERVGLGDPRGGELRRVTIVGRSSIRDRTEMVETVGWVVGTGVARKVVCFDGLEYTPTKVGERVELAEVPRDNREQVMLFQLSWSSPAISARWSPSTLAVALLLRRGETSAAERLYEEVAQTQEPRVMAAGMVHGYAMFRFHQAVALHIAGDAEGALAAAHPLAQGFSEMEKFLVEMRPDHWRNPETSPLAGIQRIRELATDAARRVARGTRPPLNLEATKDLPTSKRIALLIAHLDDVAARQNSDPGGVSLADEPISRQLAIIGEEAVDALLGAAEFDTRLTRSVSAGRTSHPDRRLHSVGEAALAILARILDLPIGDADAETIPRLRTYWDTNRNIALAERHYRALDDDSLSADDWHWAAQSILKPVRTPEDFHAGGWVRNLAPGERPMQGAALRDGRKPSVSDLLAHRATQMMVSGKRLTSSNELFDQRKAISMGLLLFQWDPFASMDTMAAITRRSIEAAVTTEYAHYKSEFVDMTVPMIVARLRLGDEKAAYDYAIAIRFVDPLGSDMRGRLRHLLAPIALFPDNAVMRVLAEDLLASPTSKWHPGNRQIMVYDQEIPSDLLAIPAYAHAVIRLLRDRKDHGEVWVSAMTGLNPDRLASMRHAHGKSESGLTILGFDDDPLSPAHETRVPVRMCDVVAFLLSKLEGAPSFRPYWPIEDRDKAIPQIEQFVSARQHRLVELLPKSPWPSREAWRTNAPVQRSEGGLGDAASKRT